MIKNQFIEPKREDFKALTQRPKNDANDMDSIIQEIFENVWNWGDAAIADYTARFDGCPDLEIKVSVDEILNCESNVSVDLQVAIKNAKFNIEKFHSAQISQTVEVKIDEGIVCQQKSVGIEKVGIYIPGGSAPLFSTVLMLAIPAVLAGCKEIVLCTPPDKNGNVNPAILWTAALCGVNSIYKVGGAQAIAAMAIGTATIPKVDKIFGPGNQYVTAAKMNAQSYGVAIDMPAGPSELLVYADESAISEFVAADLLSQAEHGGDSQVILVAQSQSMVDAVNAELTTQLKELPRKEVIIEALGNSKSIVFDDPITAFQFINEYAPEHLIIASDSSDEFVDKIINAGSVFLGNYCPESAGDYASGTNHTLPTDGWARSYNGVNVDSFTRKITFQKISKIGIENLGNTIIVMAENEQLQAHANAVKVRLNSKSMTENG